MAEEYADKTKLEPVQTNLTKGEKAALKVYQERFEHNSLSKAIHYILRKELEETGCLGARPPRKQ